jgi:hypothetical protein
MWPEPKNYNYYTIHSKFKRNFDYKLLENYINHKKKNITKNIVFMLCLIL